MNAPAQSRLTFAAIVVVACQSAGLPNGSPNPTAEVTARHLELWMPTPTVDGSAPAEQARRIASSAAGQLPSVSDVDLIVVIYPSSSSDPRIISTTSFPFRVDSLKAVRAAPVPGQRLGRAVAQQVGTPPLVVVLRFDVPGRRDSSRAEALAEWARDRLAFYADLDSVKAHFAGVPGRWREFPAAYEAGEIAFATAPSPSRPPR